MKIVITGSLGHISKPSTKQLVQQSHDVVVISSQAARQSEIEKMGASAAIGSIEDTDFLATTFTGADAVYCMEPPANFFDQKLDYISYYNNIAENYKQAIERSGVKKVVHLSSIGGHTDKGNGMLAFHYNVERIFNSLPADITIVTLRPVGFYYNLLSFIHGIKAQNAIISNYKAEYKEPWVSTVDIANVVAEEITSPFQGRKVRYIASDELSGDDIARTLGAAIGKPDLQWKTISDEQQVANMIAIGMNATIAKGLVEMNAARQSGTLFEDYNRNKPVLGKTKLTDFAKDFAAIYQQE